MPMAGSWLNYWFGCVASADEMSGGTKGQEGEGETLRVRALPPSAILPERKRAGVFTLPVQSITPTTQRNAAGPPFVSCHPVPLPNHSPLVASCSHWYRELVRGESGERRCLG